MALRRTGSGTAEAAAALLATGVPVGLLDPALREAASRAAALGGDMPHRRVFDGRVSNAGVSEAGLFDAGEELAAAPDAFELPDLGPDDLVNLQYTSGTGRRWPVWPLVLPVG